jgi:hypothetical protein
VSWLYCYLYPLNAGEFPGLDAEIRKRGVAAEFAEHKSGGRTYRVSGDSLDKLPKDEKGPYLGDDNSGHGLYEWPGPDDKGPWKRIE